jgi:hypothetical protein
LQKTCRDRTEGNKNDRYAHGCVTGVARLGSVVCLGFRIALLSAATAILLIGATTAGVYGYAAIAFLR